MFNKVLIENRALVEKALANHKYERMPNGHLLVPMGTKKADGKIEIGGRFRHAVKRMADAIERFGAHAAQRIDELSWGERAIDANLMVFESLDYILGAAFKGIGQTSAYFVAPYAAAADPSQALTHATWVAALTEFTNYTESNRQSWATDAEGSQTVGNPTTPAVFTLGGGGGTINGAALVSSSAKSSVTGLLVAASRFGAPRVLLAGDKLSIEYDIVGSDPTA